jgi:hypothetical protein
MKSLTGIDEETLFHLKRWALRKTIKLVKEHKL